MSASAYIVVAVITIYAAPIGQGATESATKWKQVEHIQVGGRESCRRMAALLTEVYSREDGLTGRARCVSVEEFSGAVDLQETPSTAPGRPKAPGDAYPLNGN